MLQAECRVSEDEGYPNLSLVSLIVENVQPNKLTSGQYSLTVDQPHFTFHPHVKQFLVNVSHPVAGIYQGGTWNWWLRSRRHGRTDTAREVHQFKVKSYRDGLLPSYRDGSVPQTSSLDSSSKHHPAHTTHTYIKIMAVCAFAVMLIVVTLAVKLVLHKKRRSIYYQRLLETRSQVYGSTDQR